MMNKLVITDLLSKEDLAELIELAEQPIENNTMSLAEFDQALEQWTTKSTVLPGRRKQSS